MTRGDNFTPPRVTSRHCGEAQKSAPIAVPNIHKEVTGAKEREGTNALEDSGVRLAGRKLAVSPCRAITPHVDADAHVRARRAQGTVDPNRERQRSDNAGRCV